MLRQRIHTWFSKGERGAHPDVPCRPSCDLNRDALKQQGEAFGEVPTLKQPVVSQFDWSPPATPAAPGRFSLLLGPSALGRRASLSLPSESVTSTPERRTRASLTLTRAVLSDKSQHDPTTLSQVDEEAKPRPRPLGLRGRRPRSRAIWDIQVGAPSWTPTRANKAEVSFASDPKSVRSSLVPTSLFDVKPRPAPTPPLRLRSKDEAPRLPKEASAGPGSSSGGALGLSAKTTRSRSASEALSLSGFEFVPPLTSLRDSSHTDGDVCGSPVACDDTALPSTAPRRRNSLCVRFADMKHPSTSSRHSGSVHWQDPVTGVRGNPLADRRARSDSFPTSASSCDSITSLAMKAAAVEEVLRQTMAEESLQREAYRVCVTAPLRTTTAAAAVTRPTTEAPSSVPPPLPSRSPLRPRRDNSARAATTSATRTPSRPPRRSGPRPRSAESIRARQKPPCPPPTSPLPEVPTYYDVAQRYLDGQLVDGGGVGVPVGVGVHSWTKTVTVARSRSDSASVYSLPSPASYTFPLPPSSRPARSRWSKDGAASSVGSTSEAAAVDVVKGGSNRSRQFARSSHGSNSSCWSRSGTSSSKAWTPGLDDGSIDSVSSNGGGDVDIDGDGALLGLVTPASSVASDGAAIFVRDATGLGKKEQEPNMAIGLGTTGLGLSLLAPGSEADDDGAFDSVLDAVRVTATRCSSPIGGKDDECDDDGLKSSFPFRPDGVEEEEDAGSSSSASFASAQGGRSDPYFIPTYPGATVV